MHDCVLAHVMKSPVRPRYGSIMRDLIHLGVSAMNEVTLIGFDGSI
jgi:hypothetical protein